MQICTIRKDGIYTMAIMHCQIKNIGRSSGKSAVASSAYRSGEKMEDWETGLVHDYTKKTGIEYTEVILCQNAPAEYQDRFTLWNEVQKIEKSADARLAREWEVAIPKEISLAEGQKLVHDFGQSLANEGMCVDIAIHDKGDGNRHAHIMGTTRAIKEDGTWAPKSKKVYDLDADGERIYQKTDKNGRKIYKNHKEDYNDWNKSEKVEEWRKRWADECNKHLNQEQQIDHRSFRRQGKEQLPTIHEGYEARQIEKKKRISERCQVNRDIREYNRLLQEEKKLIEQKFGIKKQIFEEREERINDRIELEDSSERLGGAVQRAVEENRIMEEISRKESELEQFAEGCLNRIRDNKQRKAAEASRIDFKSKDDRNIAEGEKRASTGLIRSGELKRELFVRAERIRAVISSIKEYIHEKDSGIRKQLGAAAGKIERIRERGIKMAEPMISKDYLEKEYKLAVLDFKLAHNEEEQWQARKTMGRLEGLAGQYYGFQYADQLHALVLEAVTNVANNEGEQEVIDNSKFMVNQAEEIVKTVAKPIVQEAKNVLQEFHELKKREADAWAEYCWKGRLLDDLNEQLKTKPLKDRMEVKRSITEIAPEVEKLRKAHETAKAMAKQFESTHYQEIWKAKEMELSGITLSQEIEPGRGR